MVDAGQGGVQLGVLVDNVAVVLGGIFQLDFGNADFVFDGFAVAAVPAVVNERRRVGCRRCSRFRGPRVNADVVHVITPGAKVHGSIVV